MDYFDWIKKSQSWKESIRIQCARNQTWIAQRLSPYPNLAVDLLRRQRQRRNLLTAAETSDRRLLATRRRSGDPVGRVSNARAKGFVGISKFLPVTIYSPTLSV